MCKSLSLLVGVLLLALVVAACCGKKREQGGGEQGDTCHVMAGLSCDPEVSTAEAACASRIPTHPDPIMCEDVTPDGNCRALELFGSCDPDVAGRIWCCTENTDASCAPYNEAQCDGPSSAELGDECVATFGEGYEAPTTCGELDGPAGCKMLSAFHDWLPICGGAQRWIWCC